MTGDIARAITLVTYGNAFIKDDYNIRTLTFEHPSFTFTNKIEFVTQKKTWLFKSTWKPFAQDVITWLKKLKEDGCKEIRFVHENDNSISLGETKIADHKLAGFVGGGGKRYIATIFEDHTDYWLSREEVTDKDNPDRKIWTITYGRVLSNQPNRVNETYNIEDTIIKLRKTLKEISEFSKKQKFDYWTEVFDNAIDLLDSNEPCVSDYDKKIVPIDKMTLNALQLLSASGKAWVFGGMGSWNDLWCEDRDDEKNYERLSVELYNIINQSYMAVANSYNQTNVKTVANNTYK